MNNASRKSQPYWSQQPQAIAIARTVEDNQQQAFRAMTQLIFLLLLAACLFVSLIG